MVSYSIRGVNDFLYNITSFGCLSKHFIWTSLYKSKDIISRGYISAVGFHYIFFFVSFFIPSCMLCLKVWVLDATPGKVRAGGDGDDHPAELISFLQRLPKEVSL